MRSKGSVSILTLSLVCFIQTGFGDYSEFIRQKFIWYFRDEVYRRDPLKQYALCQKCLLSSARVAGISIANVDDQGYSLIITSLTSDRDLIERNCFPVIDCKNLKAGSPSPLNPTVDEISRESSEGIQKIGEIQRNSQHICVFYRGITPVKECGDCLRQHSGSESIGEFRIAIDGNINILYLMQTQHAKGDIVGACRAIQACPEALEVDYISEDECKVVHNNHVIKNSGSMIPVNHKAIDYEVHQLASEEFDQSAALRPTHLQCVKVTSSLEGIHDARAFVEKLSRYMKELSTTQGDNAVHVHWLNLDVKSSNHAFLLLWYPSNLKKTRFRHEGLDGVEEQQLQQCYNGYQKQFDASPIGDQVFMHKSTTIVTKYHYSECVLAHSYNWESCDRCLKSITNGRIQLSQSRSLVSVGRHQKKKLGKCISTSERIACGKFQYIPNDMCAVYDGLSKWHHKIPDFLWRVTSFSKLPKSSSYNPGPLITLVSVKYDTSECLACFTLLYDVFIVSNIRYKYVWMAKKEEGALKCDCGEIKKDTITTPIHSLKPIPYSELEDHLFKNYNVRNAVLFQEFRVAILPTVLS